MKDDGAMTQARRPAPPEGVELVATQARRPAPPEGVGSAVSNVSGPLRPLEPVILEGDSVRLVPMKVGHAKALFEAGNFHEIWAYMPSRGGTLEEMTALVDEALRAAAAGVEAPFVIIERARSRIVGSTRLIEVSRADRGLEIGWTWLTPEVWRTRINTECKYLLLRHAFETVGAYRVQLKTDGRNERSQRAIERIGAVKEGILRRHRILPDGFVRDSVYYSILDTEWPAVKQRLEGLLSAPGVAAPGPSAD